MRGKPMKFTLEVVSGNDALAGEDGLFELARIVSQVAERVGCGEGIASHGTVRDINGNTVGSFEVTP